MPKGETSRPYNKTEKTMAAAKKKLRGVTRNATINAEEAAIAKRFGRAPASTRRGLVMGLDEPSNTASHMMRLMGAAADKEAAAAIRAKRKKK